MSSKYSRFFCFLFSPSVIVSRYFRHWGVLGLDLHLLVDYLCIVILTRTRTSILSCMMLVQKLSLIWHCLYLYTNVQVFYYLQ
jgi:hypothetical protein